MNMEGIVTEELLILKRKIDIELARRGEQNTDGIKLKFNTGSSTTPSSFMNGDLVIINTSR